MHDLIFLLELEKLSLNVILLWGVLVSCEFWKKNPNPNHFRLSETTFVLPSKPNIINLPNSSNHVSELKANPKKLKDCFKLPQLLVAVEDEDHRQEAVLPTC